MELSNCHHLVFLSRIMIASFGKQWNWILSQKFMIFAEMQIIPALMSNQLLKNYTCYTQQMSALLQWTIQNQAQHLQRQPQAHHDNRNCSLTNSLNVVIKSRIQKNSADSVNLLKSNLVSWLQNMRTFKHSH